MCLILLLGFELFLRTGELFKLRVLDFVFDRKGRSMVVNLGMTKSGKRRGAPEQLVCNCAYLTAFTKFVCSDLDSGDFLFSGSNADFRCLFSTLLLRLQLQEHGFRPYSVRRGGATAAFRAGKSWTVMSEIGRWASLQTLWIYVTDALAEIAAYKTEPSA